jgi:hypothetical protein
MMAIVILPMNHHEVLLPGGLHDRVPFLFWSA